MNKSLDISEFQEIKKELQKLSFQYKSSIRTNSFFTADKAKEEAIELQNKLLSYDLSNIPYSEWDDIKFYFNDGMLDFSKTHANLDFKILNISLNNRKINLEGCNVRNLENLVYDENSFTQEFVDSHPELFLDESLPLKVKDRYYKYRVTIDDLVNYPVLRKYINDSSHFVYSSDVMMVDKLFKAFGRDNLFKMVDEYPHILKSSDLRMATNSLFLTNQNISYDDAKKILCDTIINGNLRDFGGLDEVTFKDQDNYVDNKLKVLDVLIASNSILKDNIVEYITKSDIVDVNKISMIPELDRRMLFSNSSEVNKVRCELLLQLLDADDPFSRLDNIEDMFLRSSLPYVGEVFTIFEMLHPNFSGFDFSENSMVSPILKNCSNKSRRTILFSDLLKASMGSNNRSLKNYIYNIKMGDELFKKVSSEELDYNNLNFFERRILDMYCDKLTVLYNNTLEGRKDNFNSSYDNIKDIEELKNKFSSNGKIDDDLPDRIVRCFFYFAGIESLDELVNYMEEKVRETDKRNRDRANKSFVLQKGDFVKGIRNYKNFTNILQNGSVAVDFLGVDASRDFTPLDTDFAKILYKSMTLWDTISNCDASSYGDTFILIKNDDRFINTRSSSSEDAMFLDSSKPQFRTSKLESFYTGMGYGIRGGIASSEIDAICRERNDEVTKAISMEIVKNGFYIPIVDKYGDVMFTPKDYDEASSKLNGLSYYGCPYYNFSSNLVNEDIKVYNEKQIDNIKYASEMNNKINNKVLDVCSEYGLGFKTSIDGDIRKGSVEFINVGSTGRGTNTLDDKQFNFMLRLDKEIILNKDNLLAIEESIIKSFGKEKDSIDDRKLILKDVDIDGNLVDINIVLDSKKERIVYSTDMALRDRLTSIKKQDPYKYMSVISNILVAKDVLLGTGLSDEAIENMVLQNGGSFVDASLEFLKASQGVDFSSFKDSYYLWDFGENFDLLKDNKYPYVNYIDSLDDYKYENIKNTLNNYLNRDNTLENARTM